MTIDELCKCARNHFEHLTRGRLIVESVKYVGFDLKKRYRFEIKVRDQAPFQYRLKPQQVEAALKHLALKEAA